MSLHTLPDLMPVRLTAVLGFFFALIWPDSVVSQAVADRAPLVPDSGLVRGVLPSGLSYYIRHNPFPAGRVELRLVVDVGSLQEEEDQRGMAHLVEHMAFSGTVRFPGDSVWRFFERIGMSIGADVNATTGFDETVYEVTLPTDDSILLQQGFDLLEDWTRPFAFDSLMLAREQQVVTEEWRSGLGAGKRASEKTLAFLLDGSLYPRRFPIGDPELLRRASLESVRRFHRTWYRPELMALIVVGDIEPAAVERDLRQRFGGAAPGTIPLPPVSRAVPRATAPRVLVVADSELTGTSLTVSYREPRQPVVTQGDLRRRLAQAAFDHLLNQRFRRRALDSDPPFVAAGAGGSGYTREVTRYQLSVAVRAGQAVTGVAAMLDEVARVRATGFTAAEGGRARANLRRDLDQLEASLDRVTSGEIAATLVHSHLQSEPVVARADQLKVLRSLLGDLTDEAILAAGLERMEDPAPQLVASGPAAEAPDEASLLAVLTGPRVKLAAYAEPDSQSALLRVLPVPGRVRRSDLVAPVGMTRLELSNGVRVLLKPTTFDRSEVLLSAYRHGGYSLAADSALVAAQTAQSLVCASGAGGHDPVELGRLLTGRAASLSCEVGELDEGFSGRAAPADLETLLQLLYLQFTAPRLDSQVVRRYQQQLQEALDHRAAEPMNALGDTLALLLGNHHPRIRLLDSAFVGALDADGSLAWFRRRFSDATGFTFLLVGSFNSDSLLPLVERYLGGLPALPALTQQRPSRVTPPTGTVRRILPSGREPRATTIMVFHHAGAPTPGERMRVASLTQVLRHRLEATLRRREAGVYGVEVEAEAVPLPASSYRITVRFDADPARREALVEQIHATIRDLGRAGATLAELGSFRAERRRARETGMHQNGWWLQSLAQADQLGWPPETIMSDREADRLMPEDLAAAAQRYLRKANLIEVALIPGH